MPNCCKLIASARNAPQTSPPRSSARFSSALYFFARVDALHDGQQHQQYQHRGNGAQRVEAEAPKMRRAEALRDKCAAPDQGRDQRQHHLPDFRIFFIVASRISHMLQCDIAYQNAAFFRKYSGGKICTERRRPMQIDDILLLRMNRQYLFAPRRGRAHRAAQSLRLTGAVLRQLPARAASPLRESAG